LSPRTAQPSHRRSAKRGHTSRVTTSPEAPSGVELLSGAAQPRPKPSLRTSTPGQELICSGIGLTLKVGLAFVAVVSLVRLGSAYRERLDRYGEITAVLNIQQAKLNKALQRFDNLFTTGGEQRLIQEQDQWIAPNRLRVVWKSSAPQPGSEASEPFPTVEQPPADSGNEQAAR